MDIKKSSNNALRNLAKNIAGRDKALERQSSGKRINRASDDAAGLAMADQLAAKKAVNNVARQNIDYGFSMTSIADAAAGNINSILERQRELAMMSSNGTLSDDDRAMYEAEYQGLQQEIVRIAESTEFNGVKVFSGQSTTLQVGDASETLTMPGLSMSAVTSDPGSIATAAGAQSALESVAAKQEEVAKVRGDIGATEARAEAAQEQAYSQALEAEAAESRIRDADMADEVKESARYNILANSSTAILAQANQSSKIVSMLLA